MRGAEAKKSRLYWQMAQEEATDDDDVRAHEVGDDQIRERGLPDKVREGLLSGGAAGDGEACGLENEAERAVLYLVVVDEQDEVSGTLNNLLRRAPPAGGVSRAVHSRCRLRAVSGRRRGRAAFCCANVSRQQVSTSASRRPSPSRWQKVRTE